MVDFFNKAYSLCRYCMAFAFLQTPLAYAVDVDIVSYNVFMLPPIADVFKADLGKRERGRLIAAAGFMQGHDVLILNEAFDDEARKILLDGLAKDYPFQTPVIGQTSSAGRANGLPYRFERNLLQNRLPEPVSNGGVVILSKWPFIGSAQYVYGKQKIFGGAHEARTCGSDALANKGFAYVEIVKKHQRFHVVGTHTQASDAMCANPAKVRRQQFRDIAAFINAAHIHKDQMVFIGGDLNVDRSNRREFAQMLTALQANEPTWLPVKKTGTLTIRQSMALPLI
jgi:sphingomyelin phosphodiesterase